MADVLLLGAGFSHAISSSMPLLDDLSNELRSKVPNVPGDDIEQWMTYLSQAHPWLSESENLKNRALFLELTQCIRSTLSERIETTMSESPECPSWLKSLMQWCHDHKVSVISLNYDTLLESGARLAEIGEDSQGRKNHLSMDDIYPVPMNPANRRRGAFYVSGERVDSFKLFKLHGSINWYYSGASASTGETIYYSNVEPWGGTDRDRANRAENENKEFLSDKVPLIVPPTTEKVAYFQHETVRAVWSLSGKAIHSANRLFCIGYSLPETDLSIRFFLQNNAPTSKISLYIVNRSSKSKERYDTLLGRSYTIDGKYINPNAIELLVSDLLIRDS